MTIACACTGLEGSSGWMRSVALVSRSATIGVASSHSAAMLMRMSATPLRRCLRSSSKPAIATMSSPAGGKISERSTALRR